MDWKNHIKSDPNVMFGKPVITGTRIPVDLILEKMAGGMSYDDLLSAYPRISKNDLVACLLFAAESVKNEVVYAA